MRSKLVDSDGEDDTDDTHRESRGTHSPVRARTRAIFCDAGGHLVKHVLLSFLAPGDLIICVGALTVAPSTDVSVRRSVASFVGLRRRRHVDRGTSPNMRFDELDRGFKGGTSHKTCTGRQVDRQTKETEQRRRKREGQINRQGGPTDHNRRSRDRDRSRLADRQTGKHRRQAGSRDRAGTEREVETNSDNGRKTDTNVVMAMDTNTDKDTHRGIQTDSQTHPHTPGVD